MTNEPSILTIKLICYHSNNVVNLVWQARMSCLSPILLSLMFSHTLMLLVSVSTINGQTALQCKLVTCLKQWPLILTQLLLSSANFRAVNFNKRSGRCFLLSTNRNTAQSSIKLKFNSDFNYLENTCTGQSNGVCEFKPKLGILLKTVDSVYNNVSSIEECQRLCSNMRSYHCVSYDFAHTGHGVCRMSHHTSRTLSHVTEPYLMVNTSATYMKHNCYNLSVTCHHQSMMATVTSNHLFSGKIYSKSR